MKKNSCSFTDFCIGWTDSFVNAYRINDRSYIALYYSDFHIQNLSERYLKFVKVAYIILLHPVYYFMLLLYVYNQLDLTLNKGRPFLQTEVSIVK